jgi:aminopeptidase
MTIMNKDLVEKATQNIRDILALSIKCGQDAAALVIYDTQNGLTDILRAGYQAVLPNAVFKDFDTLSKDETLELFAGLKPNDLVVLIQTSNFRLDDFRIRLHLFNLKLKVIEHMHLYRNDESVWDVYIDSLAYDKVWYDIMGQKLFTTLGKLQTLEINSLGQKLVVENGLEIPKLNTGDYTNFENIGGTFPIGEVFTEAKNFEKMNGSIMVYAFANQQFEISFHEPFEVMVEQGLITGYSDRAPQEFRDIIELVKTYERPLIREIGFGLNRAITRERPLGDITAFERILGMHMSLGEKHSTYKKAGIRTNKSKFHVDLFLQIDTVKGDGKMIFEDGKYL